MMDSRVVYTLLVLILSCIIYKVYLIEVNPEEFSVASCSLRIDANPSALFGFVTQTAVLEKLSFFQLAPWLTRLADADARNVGVGKFYRAFSKLILDKNIFSDEGKIHLMITEYKAGKYLALETEDQFYRQRIEIKTKFYHDRTILSTTVYSRKTSLLFHSTVGQVLRWQVQKHLDKSLKHVSIIYKSLQNELQIYSV
ncbi:GSCOCG00006661001-RA-CDS [Cotesia congregata]|nr:GSCOCG00006661001-RA-CDS [Cotesia congregata]